MSDPYRTLGTVPPNPCRDGHVFIVGDGGSSTCLCGSEDIDRASDLVKSLSRALRKYPGQIRPVENK
jgi:hypothetical protein